MERHIWLGILSIIFCFGHIFAQKPPTSFYIDIEGNKKSFLSKEEVSIQNYSDILLFIKKEYGEDSEQYKFLLPDTAKFRVLYGFSFFYMRVGYHYNTIDSIRKQHQILPMVAISYQQATAYCQWLGTMINIRDSIVNKRNKSYTWQGSLPEKADYEMALNFKKAKITQKRSLSPLHVKYNESCYKVKGGTMCVVRSRYANSIFGLTDNVAEYTLENAVVEGGENTVLKFTEAQDISEIPIGFRCKIALVSKK